MSAPVEVSKERKSTIQKERSIGIRARVKPLSRCFSKFFLKFTPRTYDILRASLPKHGSLEIAVSPKIHGLDWNAEKREELGFWWMVCLKKNL